MRDRDPDLLTTLLYLMNINHSKHKIKQIHLIFVALLNQAYQIYMKIQGNFRTIDLPSILNVILCHVMEKLSPEEKCIKELFANNIQ